MNYILFDDTRRNNLLPLTFLRPVADIRFGILTIREKWERYLNSTTSSLTEVYLRTKYPLVVHDNNLLINGSICPNHELLREILSLQPEQALVKGDCLIAMYIAGKELEKHGSKDTAGVEEIESQSTILEISNVYDIFLKNDQAIKDDFELLTKNRKSAPIPDSARVVAPDNIFIEQGAQIGFAFINASTGPVYIGNSAEIMDGSMIRGPLALCDHAVLKMGAKIYGPTTIGPFCKVGGEVNQSVMFGYSNKAHDGFLGHSVLAEWCNLGADTNTSNLKNTYDTVKLWNYPEQTFLDTGLQFCGLIMGDHSKCGINTMFNTGTVVGVSSNIFGAGFMRNFIPSFLWGGSAGFTTFDITKALKVSENVMKRRGIAFTETERDILNHVYNITFKFRKL